MSRFWKDGRLAWPPVLAFCVSGATLIVGDYVWRVSSLSGGTILAVCGLVILATVGATVLTRPRGER